MSKRQLIDEIRRLNASAQEQFLEQFDEAQLQGYLSRLQDCGQRNIRISGWARPRGELRKAS